MPPKVMANKAVGNNNDATETGKDQAQGRRYVSKGKNRK